MSIFTIADALSDVRDFFEKLPEEAEAAAVTAINQVTQQEGLTAIRKDMRTQIDFPSGYLEQNGRLLVTKKARRGSVEAVISGRDRATSLYRFSRITKGGVRVTVRPGQTKVMKSAFPIKLRNGNMGLAYRVKAGEAPPNSREAVQLAKNLYLLYGPSVEQVFKGVSSDQTPNILNAITRQFLRQLNRGGRRG